MTRAVKAVLGYCFEQRKLHRVELRAAVENPASQRIAQRLDMKPEAVLRHEQYLNGRFVDHTLYGILADTYFERISP
jgi:ribosomal-protein-serine acetyltransferase